MSIPDYQTFMLPALQALAAAEKLRSVEVATRAADTLGVSAAEREFLIGSGKTAIFRSRSGWALTSSRSSAPSWSAAHPKTPGVTSPEGVVTQSHLPKSA
jgi:restriction endonuclease Mrr